MVSKEMIKAGERMAAALIDAQVRRDMANLTGAKKRKYDNTDLIDLYLDDEITSCEAIYTAMERAKK